MNRRTRAVLVVAAALTAAATTATAATRLSVPEQCRMPYATDPRVSVMWDQQGTTGPLVPVLVRVTCGAHGCDPIDTIRVTAFDRSTGAWRGTKEFWMPDGWRRGDLRPPLYAFEGVRPSHQVMAAVTLAKGNGRHCTITAARIVP